MALALILLALILNIGKAHPDTPPADVEGDGGPNLRVEPSYPPQALRDGIEGYVELEMLIGTDGSILHARIAKSSPGCIFAGNTLRAVRLWKFKPRKIDGVPVNRWAKTKIVFQLNDQRSPETEKSAATDGDKTVEIPIAEDLPLEEAVPILQVEPMYPRIEYLRRGANEIVLKKTIKGQVEFKVLIGTDGSVRKLCVIENTLSPLFERPAADALRNSRFQPFLRNNVPFEQWARASIAFDYSKD